MLPISLLNKSCGVLGSRTIYNATGRNLTCNPTLGRLKTYYLIPLIAQNLKYILPDFTHVTVDSTLNRGSSMRGNMKLYPLVSTFITNSTPLNNIFFSNFRALSEKLTYDKEMTMQ